MARRTRYELVDADRLNLEVGRFLWIWQWRDGGYNTCRANTKASALKKARALGRLVEGNALYVRAETLHVPSREELDTLRRKHG